MEGEGPTSGQLVEDEIYSSAEINDIWETLLLVHIFFSLVKKGKPRIKVIKREEKKSPNSENTCAEQT